MQSYIQGFVTGGLFCFAFLILSSSTQQEPSCDINLEMIKNNKKQIETIWGAIETTMDLQELHHKQCQQTDNMVNKELNILKNKVNQLINVIDNYY